MARKSLDREKALEALRQIELHSPAWVGIIRAYVKKLETDIADAERRCGNAMAAGD